MKIIISPAKSLDFTTKTPIDSYTDPQFSKETKKIHKILKTKSAKSISRLMNLSQKLSELNWQRYQSFDEENSLKRQAIFAFRGDVYLGLDSYSLSQKQINELQNKVRILSGFYGVLLPLDRIQAHRLEMGTKLKIGKNTNLYQFWGDTVTQKLLAELEKDEPLINLASNEYFQVVQKKQFFNPIITPVFQDWKNGKYKVINFFAKKARGLMVRFLLDKNIQKFEDLKFFHYGGYKFQKEKSTFDKLVFTRKQEI